MGLETPKWITVVAASIVTVTAIGSFMILYRRKKHFSNMNSSSFNAINTNSQAQENSLSTTLSPCSSTSYESAKAIKNEGNRHYGRGAYEKAIISYTEAISLYPPGHQDIALAFANRAACYIQLGKFEDVIHDCDEALKIQPLSLKAMERRAKAFESLGQLQESLIDYTASCVLDQFTTESLMKRTERILNELSGQLARNILSERIPELPSSFSLDEFFTGFPIDETPIPNGVDSSKDAKSYYLKGLTHLQQKQYDEAMKAFSNIFSLSLEIPFELESHIHHWYGTFLFLSSQIPEAEHHLKRAIDAFKRDCKAEEDQCLAQAIIKHAYVLFEMGNVEGALNEVNQLKSTGPYISYHHGELLALAGDYSNAISQYDKCISLQPDFIQVYFHKTRALVSQSSLSDALQVIKQAYKKFPRNVDIINAYGEVLVFQQKEQEAATFFDKALNINPNSPNVLLNKAALLIGNISTSIGSQVLNLRSQAIQFLKRAVQVDPKFEMAHLQLGNLLLAEGRLDDAYNHFDQAIRHARTLPELVSIQSAVVASKAQVEVGKRYPALGEKFKEMLQAING